MNLVFKEEPAVFPPDIDISVERQLELQKQLAEANKISLPDDDDFDDL